ncbi:MAG: hypothetical protein HOH43_12965 [Candidatus Latescibacteria bacterium]|jgi:hypothetical protein|nr:hypothetical protein [Candidatus Latescibacterota bacterium]
MNRSEAWFVHGATILVGVTGIVYAAMRYLMLPVDRFSVVNHPWQPDTQHLHVLAAPLMIFAVGMIWNRHVSIHRNSGTKTGRRSGLSMIMTLVPMIGSGYMIQVTVTEQWRTIWIVVHCVTSGLWIAGYVIHQIVSLKKRRERSLLPILGDSMLENLPSPESSKHVLT